MDTVIIALVILLILLGVIGSFLPYLPGSPLIFMGAFLYAWHTNFTVVSWGVLAVLLGLTLFSQLLDYVASTVGAKRYGASKWGIAGAFIGGITGVFLGGIIGIIIGPFVGAILFEMLQGRAVHDSLKIGFGTFIGFIGGAVGKFIIALVMTGIFLVQIVRH